MKEVVEEATGNALVVEKVVCHPLPKTVVFLEALFGLESHLTTADTVLVSTQVCLQAEPMRVASAAPAAAAHKLAPASKAVLVASPATVSQSVTVFTLIKCKTLTPQDTRDGL